MNSAIGKAWLYVVQFAIVCALFAAQATVAEAAPKAQDIAKGRELKDKGDEALTAFQFEEALKNYDEAWALTENTALLYNRARAYEGLTRYPQALQQILEFQEKAPAELKRKVPKLDDFVARLKSLVSRLTLVVNVSGARVTINRLEIGVTPFSEPLSLNAGPAHVEIQADGYESFARDVTLPGGGELSLDIALKKKIVKGLLTVTSGVTGATVFVDGQRVGVVPAQAELAAGKHSIRVVKEGYDDALTSAVLRAGDQRKIDIQLEKQSSILGKWWFWTAAGVVVAGGVAVTIAAMTEAPADTGTIAPGTVSAPLMAF
jgi:hypothetical protein